MTYSWAGSLLLSWLIWYQLPPIDVSLVWGIFGLALFMTGEWRSWSFLRLQAYVALACSFAHVFYANFNVLSAPGAARPEVFTVIPLVGIYFFIYWQLHATKARALRWRAGSALTIWWLALERPLWLRWDALNCLQNPWPLDTRRW